MGLVARVLDRRGSVEIFVDRDPLPPRHFREAVVALAGVEQVGGQEGVERAARRFDPDRVERHDLPFEIMPMFCHSRIPQQCRDRRAAGGIRSQQLGPDPHGQIGGCQRQPRRRRQQRAFQPRRHADRKR